MSPEFSETSAAGLLQLVRKAGSPTDRLNRPGNEDEIVTLISSQLFHPQADLEYRLKAGLLRVSELLPDGREVTRAILQTGAGLGTLQGDPERANAAEDVYPVERMIMMSLGETELLSRPRTIPAKER